jgi:hypothetical protein
MKNLLEKLEGIRKTLEEASSDMLWAEELSGDTFRRYVEEGDTDDDTEEALNDIDYLIQSLNGDIASSIEMVEALIEKLK